MIVYYKNSEIDRKLWDNCIKNSHSVKPYGYSWYLDIMSPGWEALVDDDYDSVFPVPCFSRFGIQYVATPAFLQQLGAFSPDKPASVVINEFLEYMPDFYKLIDLCVGQKIDFNSYKVTEKSNFELDLSDSYDKLLDGFTAGCRKNILIATRKKPELTTDISPEELINLLKLDKGLIISGIKIGDYDRLRRLMTYCLSNKNGKIIGVRATKKRILYGVFMIKSRGSITLLFAANTTESRGGLTRYFVINEIIKESALTRTILDFAGSSIPSMASFIESFGSIRVPYYRIYRNRLFWPVRFMK